LILLLVRKWSPYINFIVEDIEIGVIDTHASLMVVQVWSTVNACPDWRLLRVDTHILGVGFCIAGIIIGRVKETLAIPFMNEWK